MFVVFEGIDGSGKTTLSNAVVRALRERGRSVKHLRAEGKFASSVTEAIRSLARDSRNLELVPRAEFLLYVAREVQLIDEALAPALPAHDVVVADRFLYTAEVLGRGRGLAPSFMGPVLGAAMQGFEPDLVLLMDVDPSLARARRKVGKLLGGDRRPPSRKGLAGVGLQHRLRRGYLELAASAPEKWVVVDNDDPLPETTARVVELIDAALSTSPPSAAAAFHAGAAGRRSAPAVASPADALAAFVAWLTPRLQTEPAAAAYFLAGLSGPPVDPLRLALARVAPEAVLAGLRDLPDASSWELRFALRAAHPAFAARSLGTRLGTDPRAAALREELFELAPREVVASLGALGDAAAWALRERLLSRDPEGVLAHLGTMNDARAWEVREAYLREHRRELARYEPALALARSVTGLDGERAFELRRLAREAAPIAVLKSLAGLTSDESWAWRERYLARAPKAVMATLSGVDHPRAWGMRLAAASECKEALDGISGIVREEAWALREKHADQWPSTVVKSLGHLADEARGEALVRRLLGSHPMNLSLLKHASAIALEAHRIPLDDEE